MFSVFSWLRRKSAEAVVGGVADAIAALTPEGEEPPASLDELRNRLAAATAPRALAAVASEEEPEPVAKGKKK